MSSSEYHGIQQPPVPVTDGDGREHARVRAEAYRKLTSGADADARGASPHAVSRAARDRGEMLAELMRHFINSGYDLVPLLHASAWRKDDK